jgi:hypothetical protein
VLAREDHRRAFGVVLRDRESVIAHEHTFACLSRTPATRFAGRQTVGNQRPSSSTGLGGIAVRIYACPPGPYAGHADRLRSVSSSATFSAFSASAYPWSPIARSCAARSRMGYGFRGSGTTRRDPGCDNTTNASHREACHRGCCSRRGCGSPPRPRRQCRDGRAGELRGGVRELLLVTFAEVRLDKGTLPQGHLRRCVRSAHPDRSRNESAGRSPSGRRGAVS